MFLANYANIRIIPDLKRIQGVGQASIMSGSKEYSMRIWLKPNQMAAYRMSTQEALDAINDQNLEAAPGKFGEGSGEAFGRLSRGIAAAVLPIRVRRRADHLHHQSGRPELPRCFFFLEKGFHSGRE